MTLKAIRKRLNTDKIAKYLKNKAKKGRKMRVMRLRGGVKPSLNIYRIKYINISQENRKYDI